MLLTCDNLLDNFNWNMKTEHYPDKYQNKKTGIMIEFPSKEIQMFGREDSDKIEKKRKMARK